MKCTKLSIPAPHSRPRKNRPLPSAFSRLRLRGRFRYYYFSSSLFLLFFFSIRARVIFAEECARSEITFTKMLLKMPARWNASRASKTLLIASAVADACGITRRIHESYVKARIFYYPSRRDLRETRLVRHGALFRPKRFQIMIETRAARSN